MNQRIRVAELIYSFGIEGPGAGISRFVFALSNALDPERFDVSLYGLWDFGTSGEQTWINRLNQAGIRARALSRWEEGSPYRSWWRSHRQLVEILTESPTDLVHSHSEFADINALALKLTGGSGRILRTVHYGFHVEWRNRPLRRYLLSYLMYPLFFDVEIGVSKKIIKILDRRMLAQLTGRRARLIYNAIDLERFSNRSVDPVKTRKLLGVPPEAILIGSVGRLTEQKGYETFVQAAALVTSNRPDFFFLLVGDGEQEPMLRQLADQLGIQDRFLFLGPRSDVEAIYQSLDLFVSSSRWEGLPTVLMESMASSTPVVATNIPGNQDLIEDQVNGWLVPIEDPRALAHAIMQAVDHPERRAEFTRRSLEKVQAYTITKIANEYENLYQGLLGNGDVKQPPKGT